MTQSFRSAQGTIVPTIFIGMGGSGSRVVDRIAGRAAKLPNWDAQIRPLTAFVSVDTNLLDQNKLANIPPGNQLRIGAFDKKAIIEGYRRSNNRQALQWLDRMYQPRKGINPGAGQIRVESRLGFFHQSPTIRKRLQEILNKILQPGITWRQKGDVNVYIFCTVAGGTGSGSFLSMAYLISDIISSSGDWQPRVISNLMLSTLVLDDVGKDLHADIHANSYAALKELEHLTKLNYKQVQQEGRKEEEFAYWYDESADDPARVAKSPFFLSFVFDRPANFTMGPSFEAVIADASFLQLFTPNIDNMASALDNYQKNLTTLTQLPGQLSNVGMGYAKDFGCMGACAMTLPAEDLLEYSAFRFAAEAVRSQITFGLSAKDADDDRARALAKLAVNYSDPKFLNMGDEGRQRKINQAFLESVREMARQDAAQELTEGFWYQLAETVERGRATGTDEKGEIVRGEAILAVLRRKMADDRRTVIDKFSIKEKAFSFLKEGLNLYREHVSRLKEEIRAGRDILNSAQQGLKRSAREGEVVSSQKLDPITERYVVLRMLEECEQKWIPEAEKQLQSASAKDINSATVQDQLEVNYTMMQQAAKSGGFMGRVFPNDEAFVNSRTEAEDYYRSISAAAKKIADSEATLAQMRELLEYLKDRAQQYAKLAQYTNTLVNDLLLSAEDLRRGQGGEPRLALSVEVFETLDEPRTRIWDLVYIDQFVVRGRSLNTFDRATLAACISKGLKPVITEDGSVVQKSIQQTVTDLRESLLKLGRQRLRPTIFGEGGDLGLDLRRGLTLEARLTLQPQKKDGEGVSEPEIDAYIDKKFRTLSQLTGVLARVSTDEWRAQRDGTLTDKTRHLMHGFGDSEDGSPFVQKLKSILQQGDRQVNIGHWHDPRIVIVYDVELPIPLYYLRPVIDEIEKAYLKVQADEKRGYNLHTDYHWEESLPNLNPRASELQVSWAAKTLAKGLAAGMFDQQADGTWIWHSPFEKQPVELGKTLSGALYRVGEYSRTEDLKKLLDKSIDEESRAKTTEELHLRGEQLVDKLDTALSGIGFRKAQSQETQEDVLDRPVLRVLRNVMEEELKSSGLPAQGYRINV